MKHRVMNTTFQKWHVSGTGRLHSFRTLADLCRMEALYIFDVNAFEPICSLASPPPPFHSTIVKYFITRITSTALMAALFSRSPVLCLVAGCFCCIGGIVVLFDKSFLHLYTEPRYYSSGHHKLLWQSLL